MADRTTEMEAALRAVIRVAEAAKEPVFGMDPESPAAIRNGVFATIAQVAAQGLGWCGGPALDSYGVAPCADTLAGCAPDCHAGNRCRTPGVPGTQPQQENDHG